MASADLQARAAALNAKMEGEAKKTLDEVERTLLRPIARDSYACALSCYDKAGSKGSPDQLEACNQNCQVPYQASHNVVQQEVGGFQQRLQRAMMQCNDDAQGMITPGMQDDAKAMKKVEDTVLKCISKTVDTHIASLKPLKERITANLNQISKR
eukprot:CAMPEP_0198288342 /NCGR_PEP_ID=MMETSP1449-20131203/6867_1 /TAXON_ID=420275 /ORGANISM="Attheya septentrionalis, Strain CCMP2084" /LENGTH=154 /DNA_ID=CAMNT_0043986457 /DNA_START=98 /DNA_END=562 /DNA_ORIENTATION=+